MKSVVLPVVGSSSTCSFWLWTPASGTISARIIVQYRNRVLQTAVLTGSIASAGIDESRQSGLAVTTESVVRPTFAALSARQAFDLAIVHNHDGAGAPAVTAFQGDYVARVPPARIDADVAAIRRWLTESANNPGAYAGLSKPATIQLLYKLARRGRMLRRLVTGDDDPRGIGDPIRTKRVQVVAADPNSIFPIEVFYDFPAPSAAVLCAKAVDALRAGTCDPDNHGPVAKNGSIGVVCPAGFWAMNRVIERHASPRELIPNLEGHQFGLLADPIGGRDRLSRISTAMFASSNRVVADDAKTVTKALVQATGGSASKVGSWDDWLDRVRQDGPDLLVLLAHTTSDPVALESALEIAAKDRCATGDFDKPYVRLPDRPDGNKDLRAGPIVFLLGCDTARPWLEYQSFVVLFREFGASLVVGTIATVAASHAAAVACRLVANLAAQTAAIALAGDGPKAFGDVLLAARRQLLIDGEVMALSLTSYGDAQWAFG